MTHDHDHCRRYRFLTISDPREARRARVDAATQPTAHVIVLFGATGDLARRKLLPGLLRLSHAGLLPECQIVGTSLEDLDEHEFHAFALGACEEFARRDIVEAHWDEFRTRLHYVSQAHGPAGLADACAGPSGCSDGETRRLHYLSIPPSAAGPVVQTLRRGRPGRPVPDHHGEAVRHRPAHGQGAQRHRPRRLRPRAGLPDRPLPGEGGGAEHPGLPVRQRAVRAHLEPRPHRPRADRRARDPLGRHAGPPSTRTPGPSATWW